MAYLYDDEDNAPMNEDAFEKAIGTAKNCHERCRYSQQCYQTFKCKGSNRSDFPDECVLFYKIDDLMYETKAKDIPFYDPDDIPEEEYESDDT